MFNISDISSNAFILHQIREGKIRFKNGFYGNENRLSLVGRISAVMTSLDQAETAIEKFKRQKAIGSAEVIKMGLLLLWRVYAGTQPSHLCTNKQQVGQL